MDLNKYRETAKRPNRIKMDAEITTNHVKQIDKAEMDRIMATEVIEGETDLQKQTQTGNGLYCILRKTVD